MMNHNVTLPIRKRFALIAHDYSKPDLLAWVKNNQGTLCMHDLYATGATGVTGKMISDSAHLPIYLCESGPFGGDMQIGARIAEGEIDLLVSSPFINQSYPRSLNEYDGRLKRIYPGEKDDL